MTELRKITQQELNEILRSHQLWRTSEGEEGEEVDFGSLVSRWNNSSLTDEDYYELEPITPSSEQLGALLTTMHEIEKLVLKRMRRHTIDKFHQVQEDADDFEPREVTAHKVKYWYDRIELIERRLKLLNKY